MFINKTIKSIIMIRKFTYLFYTLLTTGLVAQTSVADSPLFAAGANPEELMDNKFTRSTGFVNRSWMEYGSALNHFQMGGGLNLRGFAGYLMPEGDLESQKHLYSATSGASFSSELELDYSPIFGL